MKTLNNYLTEKLKLSKNLKPSIEFEKGIIADAIYNVFWGVDDQIKRNNKKDIEDYFIRFDYPGFDHNIDGKYDSFAEGFVAKVKAVGSLYDVCHFLNEKWSDEEKCRPDDRWAFYATVASYYEDMGGYDEPYHCRDMENFIAYYDEELMKYFIK